jgi:uncharacterized membrane protein
MPVARQTAGVTRLRAASPYLLAALLIGAGVLHFVAPAPYERIVPRVLPGRRLLVQASGVAEVLCGAAVAARRTRERGALVTALLFVAVFPANVQMALDAHGPVARTIAYARLPLQVPLVIWALRVRRGARPR